MSKELGKVFNIINLYGPYSDRKALWENLILQGSLRRDSVIIGGDLNLTLKDGKYGENQPNKTH